MEAGCPGYQSRAGGRARAGLSRGLQSSLSLRRAGGRAGGRFSGILYGSRQASRPLEMEQGQDRVLNVRIASPGSCLSAARPKSSPTPCTQGWRCVNQMPVC